MTTQSQLLLDIRSRIDEPSTQFYSDTELRRWINQGVRDIARRTESVQAVANIPLVVGVQQYTAPSDTNRIYRVEYITAANQSHVLDYRDYNNSDSVWWTTQLTAQSTPAMWTAWGYPPALKLVLYPIPSETSTLRIFYYQVPADLPIDGSTPNASVSLPAGREELVVDFAEYMALRKARDGRWQEAKALFDEKVQNMIDQTRRWTDQAGSWDPDAVAGPLHPYIWDPGWA